MPGFRNGTLYCGNIRVVDNQLSGDTFTADGQLIIGAGSGDAMRIATLTAGSNVTITNGPGSITIAASGGGGSGLTTQNLTSSGTLAVNTRNYVTSGALSLALPATAAVGDQIIVVLRGGTSWTLTQGASQQMFIATDSTTLGAGGSAASTDRGDALILTCQTANDVWVAESIIGNITIV